jgi:hypothetical protein
MPQNFNQKVIRKLEDYIEQLKENNESIHEDNEEESSLPILMKQKPEGLSTNTSGNLNKKNFKMLCNNFEQ